MVLTKREDQCALGGSIVTVSALLDSNRIKSEEVEFVKQQMKNDLKELTDPEIKQMVISAMKIKI